jgi:tetratricopeptide (TPR) repeat protein
MRLAPDSAEAWRAKGSFLYHTQDFPGAAAAFAEAARREPNNPDIVAAQAYLERRLGNYSNAIRLLEHSLDRDPQDETTISSLGETLDFMQRHAEARAWYDRALALHPGDPSSLALKGNTYLAEGDLDAAGGIFDPLPLQIDDAPVLNAQMNYLMYRRRFSDVVRALKPVISSPDFVANGWTSVYYVSLGWAERLSGDNASAQATFAEGKRKIAMLRASWEDNGYLASDLAMLEAGLGDADAVDREGRRSLELSVKDKYTLSGLLAWFANAQALAGRKEQALATLEQAQQAHGVQYGDLRYSPYLDNLRDDPRFQALVNSNGIAGRDAATP